MKNPSVFDFISTFFSNGKKKKKIFLLRFVFLNHDSNTFLYVGTMESQSTAHFFELKKPRVKKQNN